MDKIWDRNPSKSVVIGRCGGDENKQMTTRNRQKSNAKNKNEYTEVNHLNFSLKSENWQYTPLAITFATLFIVE